MKVWNIFKTTLIIIFSTPLKDYCKTDVWQGLIDLVNHAQSDYQLMLLQLYHTKHTLHRRTFNAHHVYLFKQPSGLTYYQRVGLYSIIFIFFIHMAGYKDILTSSIVVLYKPSSGGGALILSSIPHVNRYNGSSSVRESLAPLSIPRPIYILIFCMVWWLAVISHSTRSPCHQAPSSIYSSQLNYIFIRPRAFISLGCINTRQLIGLALLDAVFFSEVWQYVYCLQALTERE